MPSHPNTTLSQYQNLDDTHIEFQHIFPTQHTSTTDVSLPFDIFASIDDNPTISSIFSLNSPSTIPTDLCFNTELTTTCPSPKNIQILTNLNPHSTSSVPFSPEHISNHEHPLPNSSSSNTNEFNSPDIISNDNITSSQTSE